MTDGCTSVGQAFKQMFGDRDAMVSFDEFSETLQTLGLNMDSVKVQMLFDNFDCDQDGFVSLNDYLQAYQ